MSSSSQITPDPHLADALAHAERRRAMLERLSVIGMELAEQIGAHAAAAMAAINEDKGGDPARAFATISRAIRLTLALEARVGAQILALRNGKAPAGWALGVQTAPHGRRPCEESRGEIAETLRPAREDLTDRDPVDDFEFGAFGEAVEAIRADLGLDSDGSLGADEAGFSGNDLGPKTSSLPRSGEGGLAGSGREPGGGRTRGLESWASSRRR